MKRWQYTRTAEDFWAQTKAQPNGCIYWTGGIDNNGYGTLFWRGRFERAHRVAFHLAFGWKPTRKGFICHRCDAPQCVNPKHLFRGSALSNTRDAMKKGRLRKTPAQTADIKRRVRGQWAGAGERKKALGLMAKRNARLRAKVLERDGGLCIDCGLDCEKLKARVEGYRAKARTDAGINQYAAVWAVLKEQGFKKHGRYWDADHDLALDEGGPDSIENLVTRCIPCHREKTTIHANRKGKQRRLMGKKAIETNRRLAILRGLEGKELGTAGGQ